MLNKTAILGHLIEMREKGIFIDPLLVNTMWRTAESDLQSHVLAMVDELYTEFVGVDKFFEGTEDLPFSPAVARFSLHDALFATACSVSHEETGGICPDEAMLRRAEQRVAEFTRKCGMHVLYRLYLLIVGYDVLHPLVNYKSITEEEFLFGIRHHPYRTEQLDLFLMFALARHTVRIKVVDGIRVLQLTKGGRDLFTWTADLLEQTKYMDRRIAMSYVYQFDTVQDFDDMCKIVWPDADEVRREFLEWANLPTNSHILEAGCGTGALTYDAGLIKCLGPNGRLTAIDVSSGMLKQAKRKQPQYDSHGQIHFQQASVENLPFPNGTFDACVGSAVLHFTEPPRALAELARVVIPGGTVAILQGLDFGLNQPFFKDWFEPIYAIARKRNEERPKVYLPTREQLTQWFCEAGLENIQVKQSEGTWLFDNPEVVVQHIIRGVSFFQTELMHLPLSDRKAITDELIDRGRDVCRRYSLSDRTIKIPSFMIKGICRV